MIKNVLVGNLFETDAQTLVNTVNCVGVMGKGIALEFKKRFPEMYKDYTERCNRKQVRLGEPYLYPSLFPPHVINFPTKDHWRSVSRLSDIVRGLVYLEKYYLEWGITSLAVPPLGCGNGGLEWSIVGPTLAKYLHQLEVPVYLFAPQQTAQKDLDLDYLLRNTKTRSANPTNSIPLGWIAIVEVLNRILSSPFHWPVGRVNFQKIAYFITQAGIPSKLTYQRGSYGPFSPDLKQTLSVLVNQGLIHEQQLGNMISVNVGMTYADARLMYAHDLEKWEGIIAHVVDLLLRIPTTHQAELAATVHFAANELGDWATEEAVLNAVMDWKQRRKPAFQIEEVALTIRNLAVLGWIKVKASSNLPLKIEDEAFV
jgi:uncharacterized protein YwgA/O-acetyl-ADP-ribose deacetylase (regulator of RNase III)